MKRNLYYKSMYGRSNFLKEVTLNFFIGISSMPRLLLEVFIRRNFGERYFSFSTAIWLMIIIGAGPIAQMAAFSHINADRAFDFIGKNLSLYIFLLAFLFVCLKRREEVEHLPSVFDFSRFSLSTGQISPVFYAISINGQKPSTRLIETVLEPTLFFVIGLGFFIMGQTLGSILMSCSIVYSLSYFAAWHLGDNFIMDQIDEMICNEELVSSFVDGRSSSETRGFNTYGRKPADENHRPKVVDHILDDDEFGEVF